MTNGYLTDKAYWQKQAAAAFEPFEVTSTGFSAELELFLPRDPRLSCVEIGAYPGGFLCDLAKRFGYRPTAIEYRDDADDIRRLFEHNGIDNLTLLKGDFLRMQGVHFDVVTSFGFVEHFQDYETVLRLQAEMTNPGGYLVVTVPYLGGLQGAVRRVLLTPAALAELSETHNRQIMNLSELRAVLERCGMTILHADYAMAGRFWISPASERVRPERRWLARILARLDRGLLHRLPPSSWYSPMIICIARKQ